MRAFLVIIFICPFFMATSCVRPVYVAYKLPLSSCPVPDFDLIQNLSDSSWNIIRAKQSRQDCKSMARLELEAKPGSLAAQGEIREGQVYVAIKHRAAQECELQLDFEGLCGTSESLDDCKSRGLGNSEHYGPGIERRADLIVSILSARFRVRGLSLSNKGEPIDRHFLEQGVFEKSCK